ncbi:MAG: hypothetical protein QXO21_06285 [Candidatus Anstonellales archaeon]
MKNISINRALGFLVLLFGLLYFSGCISITIYHIVDETGNSKFVQEYDFSGLAQFSSGNGSQLQQFKEQLMGSCINLTREYPALKCSVEGYKQKIEYDNKFLTSPIKVNIDNESTNQTVYSLYLEEIPVLSLNSSLSGMKYSISKIELLKMNNGTEAEQQLNQMKQFGMQMKYIVKMPGNITSFSDGGKQTDNSTVEYDLIDLMIRKKPIKVESVVLKPQTSDFTMLLVGLIVLIVVAGIIVYFFAFKKKNDSLAQYETEASQAYEYQSQDMNENQNQR